MRPPTIPFITALLGERSRAHEVDRDEQRPSVTLCTASSRRLERHSRRCHYERPATRHFPGGMRSVSPAEPDAPGPDYEQERRARHLLLGKGAVFAHRFERPLAAELDECAGTAPAP